MRSDSFSKSIAHCLPEEADSNALPKLFLALPMIPAESLVPLESILLTGELKRRLSRQPDYKSENRALTALVQALANSPGTILQTLTDMILEVFQAGSAGMSLLTKDEKRFHWPAISGVLKMHIGGGTLREFSPCGDVLDSNTPLLFQRPERRYAYFLPVTPSVEECLLIPFYVADKAVGTLWLVAHDERRRFDAEDLRQLESLGRFASAACQAVAAQEAADAGRLTALNLMEEAVSSRQLAENLNVELRGVIAERNKSAEQLRLNEQNLAAELVATQHLRQVSAQLLQVDDVDELYEAILDTAVAIMHSDFASLQMLEPKSGTNGELRLLGSRGFTPQAVKFWEWVGADCKSSCGMSLATGQPSFIADVQASPLMMGSAALDSFLDAGIYAMQSAPLLSRAGALIGMISTHWGAPHEPSASELRLIDILARQAADLIERNQAAETLRRSEARFRALFNLGPVGIYSIDATGLIEESNAVAAQLWGREPKRKDPEDRYCGSHELFFNGAPMSHEQTPMVAVLSGEIPEVRDVEAVLGRPDGSRVTVIANIVPLKNDRGEITGVMNCFYDITERKRAQMLLAAQKEILELSARGAPISEVLQVVVNSVREHAGEQSRTSLFLLEPDGLHLRLAAAAGLAEDFMRAVDHFPVGPDSPSCGKVAFTGQPEIVGDLSLDPLCIPFRGLTQAHDIRAIWSQPMCTLSGKVLGTMAIYHQTACEPKPGEMDAIALLSQTAALVIERNRESQQRQQAEDSLRESEERYRNLFNSIDEGFCVIDVIFDEDTKPVDYLFLEVNPAFAKQSGIHEATGRRMREIATTEVEAHWFETYGKVALMGEPIRFTNEFKALNRWFDVYACWVGGPGSRKVGVVFSDITERKRSEEQIQTLNRNLESRVNARTSELQEVVGVLKKEMIERQRLEREILEISEREQCRLGQDLHDGLGQELAGIALLGKVLSDTLETESHPCAKTAADIARYTHDTIDSARRLAKGLYPVELNRYGLLLALEDLANQTSQRLGIHCELRHNLHVPLLEASAEIHVFRIVQECIGNAIKHGNARRIIIESSPGEGIHTFTVSNDGLAFENAGNSGLGLHLMHYRTRIIRGTIDIRKSSESGCLVILQLPTSGEP